MKAVFILLCLAVAAFAVDVNDDFLESAMAFRQHVLAAREAKKQPSARAMMDILPCVGKGEKCYWMQGCCDKENQYCTNFLNGVCKPKDAEYRSMFSR